MDTNNKNERTPSSSTEAALSHLRIRFVVNLVPAAKRILELKIGYFSEKSQINSLEEVGLICHKIAGTAATLGFPNLGKTASLIERLVFEKSGEDDEIDAHLLMEINNIVSQIDAIIEHQNP